MIIKQRLLNVNCPDLSISNYFFLRLSTELYIKNGVSINFLKAHVLPRPNTSTDGNHFKVINYLVLHYCFIKKYYSAIALFTRFEGELLFTKLAPRASSFVVMSIKAISKMEFKNCFEDWIKC